MPSPAAPAGHDQTSKTTTSKPKRITNPLRILILTPSTQSNQTIPVLLQSLTGVPATPPLSSLSSSTDNPEQKQSFAGYTTHAPFQISNKYYSADVPIWVDEIPTASSPPQSSTVATIPTNEEAIESTSQWKTSFLSDEAREVRDAIGAIVLCVRNPALAISRAVPKEALSLATTVGSSTLQTAIEEDSKDAAEREDVRSIKELMGIVSELKSKIEEERNGGDEDEGDLVGGAEVPGILVLIDEHRSLSSISKKKHGSGIDDDDENLQAEEPFSSSWWEEVLYEQGIFGMEVIQWTPSSSTTNTDVPETRNIYGELEGLPRLKEVLSTHEWTASSSRDVGDEDDDDDIMAFLNSETRGEESTGFKFEVDQLEREMMGLRFAINGGDNEDDDAHEEEEDPELQVENLEALMMRMRAIKDMSSDLPESKRKAFAAKAVKDIMREL
ncbi:hypothetical protein EYB26_006880 [Talaromyces marneffei]|uniref:Alpha and gamma adaptin binding protein p34 n=2 Tax=Talaromyces marneffei TaxID=37727 RepID=B6QI75_TALMQ|nr:uncharacterized protein EYB26_006880 [Talaromyces marneffei]EEA23070.1 conserved hypothetical protein [Talaromyces marneffei ATCC 18224]QGA19192.1 hypothetical protein EYB26_006880 [Talaromyces marneffei]